MKNGVWIVIAGLFLFMTCRLAGAEVGFVGMLSPEAVARVISAYQVTTNSYAVDGGPMPVGFPLASEGLSRRLSAEEMESVRQLALLDWSEAPKSISTGVAGVAVAVYYHQTGDTEFLLAHLKPEPGLLPINVTTVISLLPATPVLSSAVQNAFVEHSTYIGKRVGTDEDYEMFCLGLTGALVAQVSPSEMLHSLKPALATRKLNPSIARSLIKALYLCDQNDSAWNDLQDWMTELYVELQGLFATTNLAADLGERGEVELQQHLVAAKRAHLQKLLDATSDEAIAQARRNMIPPSLR